MPSTPALMPGRSPILKLSWPGKKTRRHPRRGLLFAGIVLLSVMLAGCAASPVAVEQDGEDSAPELPTVRALPATPAPTPDPSPAPPVSECLSRRGPRITITGTNPTTQDDRYVDHELPDHSVIDATRARWLRPAANFPVDLAGVENGQGNICFSGGSIVGKYDPAATSWSTYHSSAGLGARIQNFLWENTYVENFGDGIRIANKQDADTCEVLQDASGFTIRGVYMKEMHDDCVENDWSRSGLIEDSLFEGCYTGFSARAGNHCAEQLPDSRTNVVTIQNSLVWMKPVLTILDTGTVIGNGELFKDDENSSEWALYNNIIRADAFPIGESYAKCMGIEGGDGECVGYGMRRFPGSPVGDSHTKLARCGGNVFVWLGPGDTPPPYNDSGWRVPLQDLKDPVTHEPCFTFTKDASVWEDAVQEWKARHGWR